MLSGTSGPTPRNEIGSVNSSRRSSMQDVYTLEERCGDDDVLIEDAGSSFGVLCNAKWSSECRTSYRKFINHPATHRAQRRASFPARGGDSMGATAVTWQLKVPGHTLKNGESGEQRQVEMSRGAG